MLYFTSNIGEIYKITSQGMYFFDYKLSKNNTIFDSSTVVVLKRNTLVLYLGHQKIYSQKIGFEYYHIFYNIAGQHKMSISDKECPAGWLEKIT